MKSFFPIVLAAGISALVFGCTNPRVPDSANKSSATPELQWPGWPKSDDDLLSFDISTLEPVGDEVSARNTVHEILTSSRVVPDGYRIGKGVAEYDETQTVWRVKGLLQPAGTSVDPLNDEMPYRASVFVGRDLKWHCWSVELNDEPVYLNHTVPTLKMVIARQQTEAIRRRIQ